MTVPNFKQILLMFDNQNTCSKQPCFGETQYVLASERVEGYGLIGFLLLSMTVGLNLWKRV